MSPSEGLALIEPADLRSWWFRYLFIGIPPAGTTGLARRLDPAAYYLACRWDYTQTSKALLRHSVCRVTAPSTGKSILARPVDWGPHPRTGRAVDLSPGAAAALGVQTGDVVTAELLA